MQARPQVADLLRPVLHHADKLAHPLKQVTFFGVIQGGKSTIINELLGMALLPTRANRSTGVVTRVSYSPTPEAKVVERTAMGARETRIALDDIASHVLLDLGDRRPTAPDSVEAVSIGLPLSRLRGYLLVDTPGLFDQKQLTERCLEEMRRTDLAVMVIRADKLISDDERAVARYVHRLLNGNIVYIISRLDLIDPEDTCEVLSWARSSLAGLGNGLVGNPRIFAAKASNGEKSGAAADHEVGSGGLSEFRLWAESLFADSRREDLLALSRLGSLKTYLISSQSPLVERLADYRSQVEKMTRAEAADHARRLAELKSTVAGDRVLLRDCRSEWLQSDAKYKAVILQTARQVMDRDPNWSHNLIECLYARLQAYLTELHQAVRLAVARSGIEVPPLSLNTRSLVSIELPGAQSAAAKAGSWMEEHRGTLAPRLGETGRTIETVASTWLEKLNRSVLAQYPESQTIKTLEEKARRNWPSVRKAAARYAENADLILTEVSGNALSEYGKRETLNSVEAAASRDWPAFRRAIEQYFEQIDRLLGDVCSANAVVAQSSPCLASAMEDLRSYEEATKWCTDLELLILEAEKEIIG